MKKISIENAIGEVICHDMTAILENGYKGVKFKRGHIIRAEDIPELLDIGKTQIYIWEPEIDEVHEEEAALALTETIYGKNIEHIGPSEGKYQIISRANGVFRVNSEALRRINSVGDFAVACRVGNCGVLYGETLAGLRIVPLATKREKVEAAVAIAKEMYPIFSVEAYKPLKTTIIITGSEIYTGRIKDRFEPILRDKLKKFGAEIRNVTKCPDELNVLSDAIKRDLDAGAELILMTGGMSVDPDDLTPTAIRNSGAELVTQGVPMQPGNMLTMAYIHNAMLIGVPGASMHSPVTSLDVFLPRIFAGIKIQKSDTEPLGEGGLCVGCRICKFPVCYFGNAL